ncbi:MAG: 50S ribosomal protein L32 [Treponema sp.]|jgi:large subunit ribosomal protein L32|nr:50S ribosomal protein L32 [Treponema sp.]MBP5696203.1 50S ribosomal protein L32 [Treponema sp.]MBQ1591918.1 50S ribosomal protein L32 [Treponema sp.]MBQ1643042.1 50S ribosomal protein L32 [Treponema sp.]MBQ1671524.1 50S ribosomal protein L32 [Treponema sp.]
MAVPRSKTSHAVTTRRRGVNMHLATPQLIECKNCGNLILPHHVCQKCGFYNGRQVITPEVNG